MLTVFFADVITDTALQPIALASARIRTKAPIFDDPKKYSMPQRIIARIAEFRDEILYLPELGKNDIMFDDLMEDFLLTDEEICGEYCNDGTRSSADFQIVNDRMTFNDVSQHQDCPLPIHGRCSVLLDIHVPQSIIGPVMDQIDKGLFPLLNDTAVSLLSRISHSPYLDELTLFYPKAKNQKHKLSRQNEQQTWNKPKRRSESVVVKGEHVYTGKDGDGHGKKSCHFSTILPLADILTTDAAAL